MKTETTRSPFAFPLVLALAIAVLGTFPYIYGYWSADGGNRFMGFVGRGVFGPNGYFMLARQAQDGLDLFENLSTPEPLPRVFFNLEWWLFGRMARWMGLQLIAVEHIWRIGTVFLFVFAAYYLVRQCLETEFQRRFALALMVLGSGFGWVLWLVSKLAVLLLPALRAHTQAFDGNMVLFKDQLFPLSLDMSGISVPIELINQPHFLRAQAFAALMAGLLIAGETTGKRRYFAGAGLAALAHAIIRPFNVPEMYLIFLLYPLLLAARDKHLDWKRVVNYAIPALIVLPQVVYYAWLAYVGALGATGPKWQPGLFVDHILWLGLPFLLIFLWSPGLAWLPYAKPSSILLALWLILAFLIEQAYPYYKPGQEAAAAAYWTVPAILATAGPFRYLYKWLCGSAVLRRLTNLDFSSIRFKRVAATSVVVFCMPSVVIAYVMLFTALRDHPVPHYLGEDTYAAMKWLEANARKHDTVLSSIETGQLIPRIAGIKVYLGHYMITKDSAGKQEDVKRFYGTRGDDTFKQQVIADNRIRYVLLSPSEHRDNGMNPADHRWLVPRFKQGLAELFEVVPNAASITK